MHGVRITIVQFTVHCSTARNEPPGSCSCHEEQRGHAPRHRGQSRLTVLKLSRCRRSRPTSNLDDDDRRRCATPRTQLTMDYIRSENERRRRSRRKRGASSSTAKKQRTFVVVVKVESSESSLLLRSSIASLASLDDYYD